MYHFESEEFCMHVYVIFLPFVSFPILAGLLSVFTEFQFVSTTAAGNW